VIVASELTLLSVVDAGPPYCAVRGSGEPNFSLLLRWFEELLRVLSLILCHALLAAPLHLTRCRKTFFTADQLTAWLELSPEAAVCEESPALGNVAAGVESAGTQAAAPALGQTFEGIEADEPAFLVGAQSDPCPD